MLWFVLSCLVACVVVLLVMGFVGLILFIPVYLITKSQVIAGIVQAIGSILFIIWAKIAYNKHVRKGK